MSPAFEQSLDVFADNIGLDIDFITNLTSKQISVPEGMWDDRDGKTLFFTIIDG